MSDGFDYGLRDEILTDSILALFANTDEILALFANTDEMRGPSIYEALKLRGDATIIWFLVDRGLLEWRHLPDGYIVIITQAGRKRLNLARGLK